MLIEDMKAIYSFQITLTTLRGLLLGASLTLFGGIITFTLTRIPSGVSSGDGTVVKSENPFAVFSVSLLLLGIACTVVLIMGAMNRAQYVFGAYLVRVQDELGGPAFWKCWLEYLHEYGHKDNITHGFAVAVRAISYSMSVYVSLHCLYFLLFGTLGITDVEKTIHRALLVGAVLTAIGVFFWTRWYVAKYVDTNGFVKIIRGRMEKIVATRFGVTTIPTANATSTEVAPRDQESTS